MKVLLIAQYFPPDMGGGATRASNLAHGLTTAGCDVTVLTAFPHYPKGIIPQKYKRHLLKIEYDGSIRIIRTFVPPVASEGIAKRVILFSSFIISSILALPLIGKPCVIFASNPNILSMAPSLFYKFFTKAPLVQNVDDLWPEALFDLGLDATSPLARIGETSAKIAYKSASAIVAISPAYVDVIESKYSTPTEKIMVVPAGVNLKMFDIANSKTRKTADEPFTVLYIGAFSPAYDFEQIFKASKLLSRYSTIHFVIQGGGELAVELRTKVREHQLKNVEIVDRIISRQDVAQVMSNADALILPLNGAGSIEMGISSKLYEYQAVGKPILCCSRGQPGKYISKSNSGIIIQPGDYQALAQAILTLKENPQYAQELGNNGKDYVNKHVSLEKIGFQLKQIFESLNKPN
ncbi:MAG: glycosyltransferase family 4 protein [Candidatus Bathyarchaeota archaeon]|nr:glycosyltransferase family 4 protein [Candidatus Bathyarchaeota archaeon]